MQSGELVPNINALKAALDLLCKIMSKTINLCNGLIKEEVQNRKCFIRDVYTESASLYFMDYVVWCAMNIDLDHIFYKCQDHPDWQRLF